MRPLPPLPEWVALEHDVAQILTNKNCMDGILTQRLHGNLHLLSDQSLKKLVNYYATNILSSQDRSSLLNEITVRWVCGRRRIHKTKRTQSVTSRDHISWILQTFHGWMPTQMTPTGKPIIDEVILKEIAVSDGITTARISAKCLDITKKLGMISEGTNAWLKLCTTANRIHHHCSVATNTHRCAHRKPNLGQVKK